MKPLFFFYLVFFANILFAQEVDNNFNSIKEIAKKGDYVTSLNLIDKLLKKDSSNVEYYLFKSTTLGNLKMYNESLSVLNVAIRKYPTSFDALINRGSVLLSFNETDKAIEDYYKAMSLSTTDSMKAIVYTNLGAAKIWKRDFVNAYSDLIKSYNIDSTDLGVLSNLGAVCDEINKKEETLKYLYKAIEIDSTYIPAYAGLGFKFQEMGNYQEAIKYYNKVLQLDSTEALGYSNRAFNKLKVHDISGAWKDINKSLELYPQNSYAYKIKALILIEMKDIVKACENILTVIQLEYERNYGDDILSLKATYCK